MLRSLVGSEMCIRDSQDTLGRDAELARGGETGAEGAFDGSGDVGVSGDLSLIHI